MGLTAKIQANEVGNSRGLGLVLNNGFTFHSTSITQKHMSNEYWQYYYGLFMKSLIFKQSKME